MRLLVAAMSLVGCRLNFDELPPVETCEPVVDVRSISSGRDFSCAVLADRSVRCWGAGESGQLGDGARSTQLDPIVPTGLGGVTAISAGVQHACAVVDGGSVWCWGRNDAGQLGVGDRVSRAEPARIASLANVVGVSAGGLHSCAWTMTGELYCWGQRNGTASASSMNPMRVMGLPAIANAATSSGDAILSANHACAIGTDGSAWCWGANGSGELGDGGATAMESNVPVRVMTSLAFVDIGAGFGHACGRTADGVVACWGLGADGEIGDGTRENRNVPVVIDVPASAEISVNEETTCSRGVDGSVWCWGDNDREQLARTGEDGLVPERIDVPAARAISVGARHACAIGDDGVVRCWGGDRAGQRSGTLDPRAVLVDVDAASIAAGGDTTCALGADRRVRCWGHNALGQLGDGTRTSRATPTDVGLGGVTSVGVGSTHACALGDRVACWGENKDGGVLFGGDADYLAPQTVTGIGITPTSIHAGGGHTCALASSGASWCWGNSDEGTFGRGTPGMSSAPLMSGFTNAKSMTTGRNHTCIVTATNQVFCAGRNNEAQIGRSDMNGDAYVPLEVFGAPSAAVVSAGRNHTCAISTTGNAWCWGDNVAGQIGDGTDARAEDPQTLAISNLVEIAAGAAHTCARDSMNDVWCWGANTSGQLGDQTFTTRGLPTLATELRGAVELAVGTSHTCVRMADSTVHCVGARLYGQAGGTSVPSPAPVAARLTCP